MGRLREMSGFALLIAGVIGCVLPVIPGSPMVIAGIALLGPDHPRIRPVIRRMEQLADVLESKWRMLRRRSKA